MMKIELEFKPQTLDDGVIMYSGQSDNGRGDYFAVLMKAGYLEFRYNTGSGKYSINAFFIKEQKVLRVCGPRSSKQCENQQIRIQSINGATHVGLGITSENNIAIYCNISF